MAHKKHLKFINWKEKAGNEIRISTKGLWGHARRKTKVKFYAEAAFKTVLSLSKINSPPVSRLNLSKYYTHFCLKTS